jgi:hypothetical protein
MIFLAGATESVAPVRLPRGTGFAFFPPMDNDHRNPPDDPWTAAMRAGNFEEAWKISDRALTAGINRDYDRVPRHYQCIWDGTPLRGKRVLIRCYHGLGDTIQFIRYARIVKEIAAETIVWAQPALVDLVKTTGAVDRVLPLHDGTPEVACDVDVEIMELPYIFHTTLSTVPAAVPYLHVEPLPLFHEKGFLSIGLVWHGGDWDAARNIPYSLVTTISGVKRARFYILQGGAASAGWRGEFGSHPGEFSLFDYARAVRGLDVLVTIDSMPAHLAGALDVPVLLMLHANADWRWMENRSDSPWYPSMKLFRQGHRGDWRPVIEEVKGELEGLAAKM